MEKTFSFCTCLALATTSMWKPLIILTLSGASLTWGQSVLHYRVSDTDTETVAGGSIPGADGSADGQVAYGQITLSEELPSEGVPSDAGNRSLVFDGSSGINLPGTQQLLNSMIEDAGGFTYEAWFNYGGGGNINSIIDYSGTEKLVREAGEAGASYRNNSALPVYPLGLAEAGEWHYTAVVFTPTGPVDAGSITGDLTFYYDSNVATETIETVTISDFGDSLNRTIAVGAHPQGFPGDFLNGLVFEPRVSLGALAPEELLFGQSPLLGITITELERLEGANRLVWTSRPGQTYSVEYSFDLQDWKEINDAISSDAETTEFTQTFAPGFEEVAEASKVYYRVIENAG